MKKTRIITKRRISYVLMAAVFMLCCLLFVSDSISFFTEKYQKSTGTYLPMEYEIDTYEGDEEETTYTQLSSIYNISGTTVTEVSSSQTFALETLLIATAEELYAFSVLANNFNKYLTYDYKLSANIDYSECLASQRFTPIAWAAGKTFSGTFDGDGFEIRNLNFVDLDSSESPIATLDYFAMFSKNSGTIKNLGLVDTIFFINLNNDGQTINISGVAPLCGLNTGTIENVYAVDLGDAADEESGIYAAGGYTISGLVFESTGTLRNAYTAYSIISNYSVSDLISFHEIVSTVSGSVSNLYFYNASIDSIERKVDSSDGITKDFIKYDNGLIGKTYARSINDNIAYCDTLNSLAINLDSNSVWYTKNSYTDSVTKDVIGLETPILRGLDEDANDSKTLYINSTKDFLYMFELMNHDSIFASNTYTYKITADIDLSNLPDYTYEYNSYINATIVGTSASRTTLKDVRGDYSPYPTIYGASISNTVLTEGIECFGLFPYLTGTIQNLNLYYLDTKLTNFDAIGNNANIRALGLVSGIVEGGTIDNVNVYGNVVLNSGFGRHYVGGITGVLTEKGSITNCTTAGRINAGSGHAVYNNQQVTGYINGNSIGGVVGFATATNGTLNACMSAMNLTLASYSSSNTLNQTIGGVLGSGYTSLCGNLDNNTGLSNKGSISIGQTSTNYGIVYAAGIIGRHLGLSRQVNNFYNQGDITFASNANTNYVSGIANVDVLSSTVNGLSASTLKNSNGKLSYWASSFTNAANITITGSTDVKTSGMVYINTNEGNNNYASEISGFYNIGYRTIITNGNPTKQTISANEIDFSSISNYAACVVSTGISANNSIKAETIYNLKDINFTTSENIQNTNMNYSGAILGKYIDLIDIRNEGNLTFTISNATSNNSTLNINGVFEEISANCNAENIFNGGNITITDADSNTKYIDMYISGICKTNNSVITDNKYNPLNEDFDNTTVGSLNNAINNGDILVTQSNLDRNTASNVLDPSVNLYSNIYAGGITYSNSGIISNTFNLGRVDIEIFSKQLSNYHVGGIASINTGEYAQIRDCANNGDLYVIDMSDDYASSVNVGGIVSNNINVTTNISQVIAFTINYGTIFGFQVHLGMETTAISVDNFHTACGGIMGQGLCNMVNIVNYGNVYSSECGGGLAAVVDLGSYANKEANIANTINYANIMAQPISYADNINTVNYLTLEKVRSMDYVAAGSLDSRTYVGALIALFDFNSQNNVNVRYLINFYNAAAVVLRNINVPSTSIDVSTFITTRGSVDIFGPEGNYISYAPLSTIDEVLPDGSKNIGAFSENFVFRKAINGIGLNDEYVTDSYIGDFFQFVRFDKINDQLLKSMGWETIAYADAAENLAKNLDALSALITKSSSQNLLTDAFSSKTWLENGDSTILKDYIELSIDSNELDSNLKEILNYVLFDESCKSAFTSDLKSSLFSTIITYYEAQEVEELNYYNLLNKLLYPELVARIISGDTSDLAKVQTTIEEALSSCDNLNEIYESYVATLSGEGNSETSILDPLFDNDYYTQSKINLLNTLLKGYSEETLQLIFDETTPSESGNELKYLMYLQANTNVAKDIYLGMISLNSLNNEGTYLDVIDENLNKYNVEDYLTTENIAVLTNLFPERNADDYIQDELTVTKTVQTVKDTLTPAIDNYVVAKHNYTELWNMIKTDSNVQEYIQNNYFNTYTDYTYGGTKSGLLAKATEYNNSYQSNDKPQSWYGIPESFEGGINYGGSSGGDYFDNTTTQTNTHYAVDQEIKTRFIYTPDELCSSGTYYYGPYDSTGNPFDQGGYLTSNNLNYHLGFSFTAYDANQTAQKVPGLAPVFISVDQKLLNDKLASVINDKTIDEFYWNDSSYGHDEYNRTGDFCWKTIVFVQTEPGTLGYLFNNYNTGDYIKNYYDFNPDITYTKYYDQTLSNIAPNGENITLMNNDYYIDENGEKQNIADVHQYQDYYLTGYISTSIMTGIWYTYSKFKLDDRSGTSLFGKNQKDNYSEDYYGVHTTDYICYTISDLVKLDGIKTKGMGSNSTKIDQYHINDNDEISIISSIVENMLVTEAGQLAIMKAIDNYYKGNNVTTDNYEAAEMLLSSLAETEFANEFVINTLDDILTLGMIDPNTLTQYNSISDYLEGLNVSLDNIKDEIITRATHDMSNFRKVILATDVICSKIENYSDYQYDRNEVNRLIYNYILNRYGQSQLEGDVLNSIFTDSSDDLSYIDDLLISTTTEKYIDDSTYAGFTISNATLYTSESDNFNATTINGIEYNRVLVGNSSNSRISFTTENWEHGYTLDAIYSGEISLYNSNNVLIQTIESNSYTSTKDAFNLLSKNQGYYLEISNANILHVELGENSYEAVVGQEPQYYDEYGYIGPMLSTPTITAQNTNSSPTIDSSGIQLAYKRVTNQSATINFELAQLYDVNITSIRISFDVSITSNNRFSSVVSVGNNSSTTLNQSNNNTTINETLNDISNGVTINFSTSNTNTTTRYVNISNMILSMVYTLVDGTTVTFTQNLLDSSSNSIQMTNSTTSYMDVVINNTTTSGITVTSSGYTPSISNITAPITFKPYYYVDISETFYGEITNTLNLDDIILLSSDGLADNFNNYYANISDIGKYIIEDVVIPVDSITSVTVTEPSFLIIYVNSTNSNGIVSINNNASPSSVTIDSATNKYYAVYLPSSGTYTISPTNTTICNIYVVDEEAKLNVSGNTITDLEGNVISNLTYSDISQFNISSLINDNSLTTSEKYEVFMDSYLYYRDDYSSLRNDDIFEFVFTLYGTITEINNSQTYYTVFSDEVFTDNVLKNIIELIILGDDTAFSLLIDELSGTYYDELLKSISDEAVQKNIAEKIVSTVNGKSSTYPSTYLYTLAAYLGNDYLSNLSTLNNSIMYTILSGYSNGIYQFINDDNSINAEVFTKLLEHLTEGNASIDLEGYGIFALSSSKGILNGQFIPDNIALDSLDSNYTYNSTDNHWELSNTVSSNWRGGNDASNKNDTSNIDSVNYGVLVEMKQLKKSISTTIFTLDLAVTDDGQEVILYSSEELIDLENHVITYYVPEGLDLSNVSINEYSIANSASFTLNKTSPFSLESDENETIVTFEDVVTIIAEDTSIVADYSIVIVRFDIESINLSLDQAASLGETVPSANGADFDMNYIDGYISLNLTSQTLPKGLDIEPYLSITDSNDNEINTNNIIKYELDTKAYIDENGSTKINIILLDTMTYGLYTITVDVFGVSDSITFYKKPSTLNSIESFIYEGNDLVNEFNNNLELTTYIPFGRCYDYAELIDASYLSAITVSTGATLDIQVSKNDEALITYTIHYTVTSESGVSKDYYHYLVEMDPLDVDGNIANVYRNGSAVNNALANDNTITLSFRRGEEAPSYKIKYNLTNIYNDGTYDYVIGDEDVNEYIGVACDAKYSGMTIEISDVADAGTYLYHYTFINSGEWSNGTYTETYTFPLITIIKNYAVDAELKRLTFLDSQLTAGAAYTVMYPDYSIRPSENISTNEVRYNDLRQGVTLSPISVAAKTITYDNNSSASSNFYAVGTLDNAELSNYAPTFGIYEYSEIYQYTTLDKLTGYGTGHDVIDYNVVSTNSAQEDLYLYVPYEDSNNKIEIFMVKVEDGVWTDVYDTSFDGSENYPTIATNIGYKGSFGNYTISDTAGTTSGDNKSLYMDYIGTPLNDHFWWVSYVVFSEDYMRNPSNENTNLKFYHVSLIDISNTIYFEFTFDTPENFDLSSMYISIVDRVYDNIGEQTEEYKNTVNINAFATLNGESYSLVHKLQVLPRGYFYFNITLPGGYTCTYTITNGKTNQNANTDEDGAYLPPASIVTQKVDITVTITKATESDTQTDIWAESTSSDFVIQATEVVATK